MELTNQVSLGVESLKESGQTKVRYDLIQSPIQQKQWLELVNQGFGVPDAHSFYEDFPVWNEALHTGKNASIAKVGAFVGDQLVATASIRLSDMKTNTNPIQVGLIGSVVTSPQWRGQGLAKHVVSLALQWGRTREITAAILWGSELDLYRKIGFELCGEQVRVPLDTIQNLVGSDREQDIRQGWSPQLFKLIQRRPGGLNLRPDDIFWFSSHKNVDWYWIGQESAPRAYAAVGRGIDLEGFVHEWGGESRALMALLVRLNKIRPGLSLLGSRWALQETGLHLQYNDDALEYLCMAKVYEPELIYKAFYPGETFPKVIAQADPSEWPQLLFGPASVVSAHVKKTLPLWIWGLDAS